MSTLRKPSLLLMSMSVTRFNSKLLLPFQLFQPSSQHQLRLHSSFVSKLRTPTILKPSPVVIERLQVSKMMSTTTEAKIDMSNLDPVQMDIMNKELIPVVNLKDQVTELRSKKDCHLMANIKNGLLHRAFSVLLFNSKKEFLLTQRSDSKITFPGHFTNACCSHPASNEEELDKSNNFVGIRRAAKRRLVFELGIKDSDLDIDDIHFMTRFVYMAPSEDPVWGEHEMDYVLIIHKDLDMDPNRAEVKYHEYMNQEQLEQFMRKAENGQVKVSQWFYKIYKLWLSDYWNNLDNLNKFKDWNNIHMEKISFRGTEI